MKLKLEFDFPKSILEINLKDSIFLIGSCFSDEIGGLLKASKFNSMSNPFGTIYNPISIFGLLINQFKSNSIVESAGISYHWQAHGTISGLSKEQVETAYLEAQSKAQEFLSKSKWLIITLGTAWVYQHKVSDEIVANCHKVPSSEFTKRLLETDEIVNKFRALNEFLKANNPNLNIIMTVSPVRHVRDGLIENNRSKAVLIESIRQIQKLYPFVSYFPSYEISIDELRDYRFFKEDLVHPSGEAIEYIWKQFSKTYFDNETMIFVDKWKRIQTALNHKAIHPHSAAHQTFLKETLTKLRELNDTVDLRVEMDAISSQII